MHTSSAQLPNHYFFKVFLSYVNIGSWLKTVSRHIWPAATLASGSFLSMDSQARSFSCLICYKNEFLFARRWKNWLLVGYCRLAGRLCQWYTSQPIISVAISGGEECNAFFKCTTAWQFIIQSLPFGYKFRGGNFIHISNTHSFFTQSPSFLFGFSGWSRLSVSVICQWLHWSAVAFCQ